MKKFYYILFLLFPVLTLVGCTDEDGLDVGENQFVLNYTVRMSDDVLSRAVGDGSHVDELIVGVFEKDKDTGINFSFDVNEGKANVSIALFKDKEYNLIFWAQKSGNTVYDTENLSNIKVDYKKIQQMPLSDAMALDAFSAIRTEVTANTSGDGITLKRPFTMISTGASGANCSDIETAELTLSKVYTSYQPLAGTVGDPQENVTLTFTHVGNETFEAEGETFNYMTTAFLFVSEEDNDIKVSGSFLDANDDVISSIEETPVNDLTVNHRNHFGKPLTEGWDGETRVDELLPDEGDGIIHIENAAQMVYLLENGYASSDDVQHIHLCKDLDMKGEINRSDKYALKNVEFDGGGFTLYNLPLPLFGESEGLSVKNITLKKANISEGSINGALAVTVKGNASFSNITIDNCDVKATDIAGSIVGYISRISKDDRSETLDVTFDNCHVKSTELLATVTGKMVGELSGYDNGEKLMFANTCTVEDMTDGASLYVAGNQSEWMDAIESKYDGWLGNETYHRGVVKFGDVQLLPKWDGTTNIAPLTDGTTKLIYSAFDLAYLQEATGAQVTFKSDVDMGSKVFVPIMTATKVYGKKDDSNDNYIIYNLKVDTEFLSGPWYGGAFIRKMASGSVENITIKNANVSVKNAEGGEDAYASILVATIEGNNVTVKNVRIDGGYLKGINKIGGIAGYVSCNLQATNCIVSGLTIENFTTSNTGDVFESYGEIGGLIGFIQGNGSVISQCQVNNSTLNVKASLLRYNNRFIGTANPSSGQNITIETNCSATGNSVTNESRLKYGGILGGLIGGKTFDLLGGYSLSVAQGGTVYYGTTKLK